MHRSAFLGFLFWIALCPQVRAQNVPPANARSKMWASFGLSTGQQISTDPHPQTVGWYVRAGTQLSSRIRLGGEWHEWTWSTVSAHTAGDNQTATLLFYPPFTGKFFAKIGIGLAEWRETVILANGGNGKMASYGWGMTIGAGYDLRLSDRLAFTPGVDWLASRVDDRWNDPRHTRTAVVTVGLTVR